MRKLFPAIICCLALFVAMAPNGRVARAQPAQPAPSDVILLPVENRPDPIPVGNQVQEENYSSGEVKIRRQITVLSDESWVNQGLSTEFYKNGQKFAEGQFKNGIREGEWTFWFEDGTVCKTVNFTSGVPDGEWNVNWQDGKRRATRKYEGGKPQGTWATYAADGETMLTQKQFEGGLADGKWVENYPSGKPHVESYYEQGKRHGKYTEWDEQGQVVRDMTFKEGQLDGRLVVRGQGGKEIVQFYRDGQLLPDGPEAGNE